MPWTDGFDDEVAHLAEFVIVSAVPSVGLAGPETYIFPARLGTDGVDIDGWSELTGSYQGGTDHSEALRRAGYTVIR